MATLSPPRATTIRRLTTPELQRTRLLDEVRAGLRSDEPWLPTYLLYLGAGGRRFDEVAGDPRYRLARREQALLRRHARSVVHAARPEHVVELGGGASDKLALLVAHACSGELSVTALDVDEPGVLRGLDALASEHPHVASTEAIVADMLADEVELPRHGRRVVALLGSTFGNFDTSTRAALLQRIASTSRPGDGLLLGIDVNGRGFDQFFAYSSAAIARFNREAFATLGALLDAPLSNDGADHHVAWDELERTVRVQLVPRKDAEIADAGDGAPVLLRAGVPITTATSRKPRPDDVDRELVEAGFTASTWWFDDSSLHALVLARL